MSGRRLFTSLGRVYGSRSSVEQSRTSPSQSLWLCRKLAALPGSSGPFLLADLPGLVWRESPRCGTVTCGDVRARWNQHDWLLSSGFSGSSARLGLLECWGGGGGLAEHLEPESGLVPRTGRGPASRLGPVCWDHRLGHWPFQRSSEGAGTSEMDVGRGRGTSAGVSVQRPSLITSSNTDEDR